MHPAQQHGRRSPFRSLSCMIFIRCSLVSSFFADMTQHIHSLRASGVISSHTARAIVEDTIAFLKSIGTLCTTPEEILFLTIVTLYQNNK